VLKLARDATSEELRGRIENLVTLEHADFTSAIELCELLARDVDATGAVANSGG
jgi:hypothetical protein